MHVVISGVIFLIFSRFAIIPAILRHRENVLCDAKKLTHNVIKWRHKLMSASSVSLFFSLLGK